MVSCTNHCSGCGKCFHSIRAFDTHRIGDHASNDPETRRRCAHPLDLLDDNGEMRLVALSEQGVCRAYEAPEAPVSVWTMRDAVERAREVWGLAQNPDTTQKERPSVAAESLENTDPQKGDNV
jgi:hypothetical protein